MDPRAARISEADRSVIGDAASVIRSGYSQQRDYGKPNRGTAVVLSPQPQRATALSSTGRRAELRYASPFGKPISRLSR